MIHQMYLNLPAGWGNDFSIYQNDFPPHGSPFLKQLRGLFLKQFTGRDSEMRDMEYTWRFVTVNEKSFSISGNRIKLFSS